MINPMFLWLVIKRKARARDDHFRFGLVLIKKNNQTEIKTSLARFFPVWVRFGSVFLVLDL